MPVDLQSYMRPVPVPADVQREGKAFLLRWQPRAEHVRVYAGPAPDQIDRLRPILHVSHQQEAVISGVETAVRPTFELAFSGGAADGRRLTVAERSLPLSGAVNFRDIGGYLTADGQQVRWGRVYRSGMLAELTPEDHDYLQQLGVRLVCDLRSQEEVVRRPNQLDGLAQIRQESRPIQSLDRGSRLRSLFTVLFRRSRLSHLMRHGYSKIMLDRHAPVFGDVFRWLADDANLPVIIHCTAGKDRTGLMIALLLYVLDVPWETILGDYTLSNHHYEHFRQSLMPDVKPLMKFGVTIDDLWALLVVDPATLEHAFDHIRQEYGSIDQYLFHHAGVDDAVVGRLRQNLLRPVSSDRVDV